MRLRGLALVLGLLCVFHAQAADNAGSDIRAGREALGAGQPVEAKSRFEAALANPEIRLDDRYAALVGLGRAEIWLGDYRAAREGFEKARKLAQSDSDREVAATGLAQALNALDYPRQAYVLLAPFAKGNSEASLEALKAQRVLGWQDQSPAYLAAVPAINPQSRLGAEFRRIQADTDYALARRVEGGFDYQHDSDGLTLLGLGAGVSLPANSNAQFARWGVSTQTWRVDDGQRSNRVVSLDGHYATRLGEDHSVDLSLGAGESDGWNFIQGRLGWGYRPTDIFGIEASAERTPILTPVALAGHMLYNTYTLGFTVRPGDQWYILPAYYHQDFSDGNRRDGGVLRIRLSPYDIPHSAAALGAEIYLRTFHSDLPGGGRGYFNPTDFHEEQLKLIGIQRVSSSWKLRALAGGGSQTVDGDSNPIYSVELALEGRLPGNGRLRGVVGRSSVSSQSGGGAGYWNDYLSLSLAYPF
ncbi:MAG TPA: hypothetical protein VEP67_11280 [Thiobacillaceae bacterium]|nr:hypothetical protein [Thiobacillaceae bacterium]